MRDSRRAQAYKTLSYKLELLYTTAYVHTVSRPAAPLGAPHALPGEGARPDLPPEWSRLPERPFPAVRRLDKVDLLLIGDQPMLRDCQTQTPCVARYFQKAGWPCPWLELQLPTQLYILKRNCCFQLAPQLSKGTNLLLPTPDNLVNKIWRLVADSGTR